MSYQVIVTLKENQITLLKHLEAGLSQKEIAVKMNTNEKKVNNMVCALLEQSGTNNKTALVAWAIRKGII